MLAAMLTRWLCLVVFASCYSGKNAVQIHHVGLFNSKYIKLGGSGTLSCDFTLDGNEILLDITWRKDNEIFYIWQHQQGTQVLGSFSNHIKPATPPWNVNITNASTQMEGNYTCTAVTDKGSSSSHYYLIVLLLCKARIETEDLTGIDCTVGWNIYCSRMYPELNFTAGIYLPNEDKFFDKVTSWTKIVYSDNTFGYNLIKSYKVNDIPKESVFLWKISYKEHFPLVTGNFSFGAVHKSGCPSPPQKENMSITVLDGKTTCRGEIVPSEDRVRAGYSCLKTKHQSESRKYKVLLCSNNKWEEENDSPWPNCSPTGKSSTMYSLQFKLLFTALIVSSRMPVLQATFS